MFKARLCHTLSILLLLAGAHAATLLVYPFSSDDSRLGTAVSHAVAEALQFDAEVLGPAVAPMLVPPFLVDGGYYNPQAFFEESDGQGLAMMLRSGSGADYVLTGDIGRVDDQLVLELQFAHPDGVSTLTLQATSDDPTHLAQRTTGVTARLLGLEQIPVVDPIDLEGADGALATAIHHAGLAGGIEAALAELDHPEMADDRFAQELREAILSVLAGEAIGNRYLLAALSLNTAALDETRSAAYFRLLQQETDLPAARLWEAVLLASSGDTVGAGEAFEAAAVYPYGRANLQAWQDVPDTEIAAAIPDADASSLLTYALLARSRQNFDLEKQALRRLTRIDPWQVFAFERLSFIAFDQDEPMEAGQALAVAVTLEPGSDLYWTNLGWAQYLLGLLEQSEESSIRATLLSPGQTVAHYNLGLVRTVTGRLSEAINAYNAAMRVDPLVDQAAIDDLEEALQLYPREPAVHYSLAYLLEADGQRARAGQHYGSYARRVPAGDFAERARARIQALAAPPPELELPGGVSLFLGNVPVSPEQLQAGDPLRPTFEVYTPGEVLPTIIWLDYSLLDSDLGQVASEQHQLTLPSATVGFVIDGFTFRLPMDLTPGDYTFKLTVSASDDREASTETALSVAPSTDPLRALFGYGITLQSVETGSALFGQRDLGRWSEASSVLQRELALAAPAAAEVVPEIGSGRFQGMDGGEAFSASTEADIRDFLGWIAHPDLQGSSFVFVDTYAQWALEGAPVD